MKERITYEKVCGPLNKVNMIDVQGLNAWNRPPGLHSRLRQPPLFARPKCPPTSIEGVAMSSVFGKGGGGGGGEEV